MEWKVEKTGMPTRVILDGDFDMYSGPVFRAAALAIDLGKAVEFDLAGVEYLDSTGVGVIIAIIKACKERGTVATFSGVHGSPLKVLGMSGILGIMGLKGGPK